MRLKKSIFVFNFQLIYLNGHFKINNHKKTKCTEKMGFIKKITKKILIYYNSKNYFFPFSD